MFQGISKTLVKLEVAKATRVTRVCGSRYLVDNEA
jgi:hypothetical protein